MGLGSKSPFSYVSSFVVESRHNGTKYTYTAFINEKHLPSISLIGKEETDEPNGMTITFAVKYDDFYKFKDEAKKALMYFNPKPVVTGEHGFEPYTLKHSFGGAAWKVREAAYYSGMHGPYVVQGFVAYPVDIELLRQQNISKAAYELLGVDIDYTVNIGDVEVAASREALSYDPTTIRNLVEVVEQSANELRIVIQKEIDSTKTLWAATVKLNSYLSGHGITRIVEKLCIMKPFTWGGANLTNIVGGDAPSIRNTSVSIVETGGKKLKVRGKWIPAAPPTPPKQLTITPKSKTIVYIDDQGKNANQMVFHDLDSNGSLRNEAVIIRSLTKQLNEKEVKEIIKLLGNPSATYISTLPEVTVEGRKTAKREKGTFLRWSGFQKGGYQKRELRRVFSRLCWLNEVVDIADGGVYVPIERFTIKHKGQEVTKFDEILWAAKDLNLVTNDHVYGFSEKEIQAVQSNKKWINLFSLIETNFKAANVHNELLNAVDYQYIKTTATGSQLEKIISVGLLSYLEESPLRSFINEYKTLKSAERVNGERVKIVGNFIRGLSGQHNGALEKTLDKKWTDLLKKYPLLTVISWEKVISGNAAKMVAQNLNTIS